MNPTTDQAQASRSFRLFAPTILILLAFALRIWRLDAQALSGDEAFSIINWTRTSLHYLLTTIAVIDPQPPIALLSLYSWVRLVGDSVFAARMLSVLLSTISVAAAYSLADQLLGRRAALIAALLTALNPFQLWYAQDIRSYAPWISLSALTLASLVRAFRSPTRTHWLLYIFFAILGAYTYYLEIFLFAAHNLYALSQIISKPKLRLSWILAQLAIAAVLAPWYLQPSLRHSGYQPTAGGPQFIAALQTFLIGATLPPEIGKLTFASFIPPLISLLIVVLIAISLINLALRYSTPTFVLLASASLLPPAALAVLALVTGKGYFHPRYVAASAIPLIVLLASLAERHRDRIPQAAAYVGRIGLAIVAVLGLISFAAYRSDPRMAKAPPWPEIVRLLNEQAASGDLILRNYPDPAFDYYYAGNVHAETLPLGENPPPEQTTSKLAALATQYRYIWFMPVNSAAYDRDHVVATWLSQNMQLISEQHIGPTLLIQYTSWDESQVAEMLTPAANFDALVLLKGFRFTPLAQRWDRGTTIAVELIWEPLVNTPTALKLYVHLIGPVSVSGTPLWAQDDHLPQVGRLSSTDWIIHQSFRDVFQITIPANAASGDYWLTTGLYDPVTGKRIPLNNNPSGIDENSAVIASFHLP
jgi:hypothetical protein